MKEVHKEEFWLFIRKYSDYKRSMVNAAEPPFLLFIDTKTNTSIGKIVYCADKTMFYITEE